MPEDFLIARNPEDGSTLPYLVRIPLGEGGIVLMAREKWPRITKVYCHRAESWPEDAEVVERVPTRSCERRGAAIDLVLDRARENRSQFVLTVARGRQVVFWQSARTTKQARPRGSAPTARALGQASVEIVVDVHERYAWGFAEAQVSTRRAALPAGDYGIEVDGALVASVERKSLEDLVATLTSGRLKFLLAELAALPRAAVVVEERYSQVFNQRYARSSVVADGLAEAAARFPQVPIVFAETRPLAQQWAYRFLVACREEYAADALGAARVGSFAAAPTVPAREPTVAQMRAWAVEQGWPVSDRGRLRPEVVTAYRAAHERT